MPGDAKDSWGVSYTTDPRKRMVEGYINGSSPPLTYRMPVISEIVTGLWMGGVDDGLILPEEIKDVVSLHPHKGYVARHKLNSHLTVVMEDSVDQPLDDVYSLSRWVASRRGPTLVHCHMGLNRSGLIVAGSLMHAGFPAEYAIQLIREKRSPAALCNSYFEKFLLEGYVYG